MLTLVIGNKNYSSWSLRPWLAMTVLGLDFTELRVPLYLPSTHPELLKHAPVAQVPLLKDGDLVLWDSAAILAHLVERHPEKPWWPADAAARATARSVSAEMGSGFRALRTHMPMNIRREVRVAGLPQAEQAALDRDIERVKAIWRDARARFGVGGRFLFGQFSIADAMFAPVVWRFRGYGVELGDVEEAYVAAMLELPAMKAWAEAGRVESEKIKANDDVYA